LNDILNINQHLKVSEQAKIMLDKIIIQKDYKKGKIILKEGEICKHLYFIKNGFARGFISQNGKDITSWFAFENDVATPLYSFVTRKPGFESIEILEDSTFYAISYENIQQLYRQFPEFNLIGRIVTEKYYIELMTRTMSFQFQSAKERYLQLIANQPQLLHRASLGHIASYLGISQETLSRIRTKI
jgi:CRP/FNR family transcriptional regulator, anaerobic regulatory protein